MNKEWTKRKSVWASSHFEKRIGQYEIGIGSVLKALGVDVLVGDNDDFTGCQRAKLLPGGNVPQPELGRPVHLGRNFARTGGRNDIILAVLPGGRRVHLVIGCQATRLDLITTWCPDDPQNAPFWHPHALMPTRRGVFEVHPADWFLGDPMNPGPVSGGAAMTRCMKGSVTVTERHYVSALGGGR